jgi:hypothetical protein
MIGQLTAVYNKILLKGVRKEGHKVVAANATLHANCLLHLKTSLTKATHTHTRHHYTFATTLIFCLHDADGGKEVMSEGTSKLEIDDNQLIASDRR